MARARCAARRARSISTAATCSTPPAPAATAPARSTSRPARRWSRRRPACRSPSTAIARSADASARADVLERFGVKIDLDPDGPANDAFAPPDAASSSPPRTIRRSPASRPCAARSASARIFNLIAPLANPARPRRQLLGVAEPRLLRPMAEALAALGVDHAMVVHGDDGLDEISLAAPTRVAEIRGDCDTRVRRSRPRELRTRARRAPRR